MRKYIAYTFAFMGLALLIVSCGGDTYAKRLKKEKKAIHRFITDNEINVLDGFPGEGYEYGEKEYYKDSKTGVYIRVIDYGTGEKARKQTANRTGTKVYMKLRNVTPFMLNDSTQWSNTGGGQQPMELVYGLTSSYTSTNGGNFDYFCKSPACTLPLEYIREGAKVSFIVPFLYGSGYQSDNYHALYYEEVEYITFD